MNKWKRWKLWTKVRCFAEKKMADSWMQGGNCDSRCPQCKQWESHGNKIKTTDNDDGSVDRLCGNCKYEWKALFTPAGFIPVKDFE